MHFMFHYNKKTCQTHIGARKKFIGSPKSGGIHPLGTMNIWTIFFADALNRCWDISMNKSNIDLLVTQEEKRGIMLWVPWMFSAWSKVLGQPTDPWIHSLILNVIISCSHRDRKVLGPEKTRLTNNAYLLISSRSHVGQKTMVLKKCRVTNFPGHITLAVTACCHLAQQSAALTHKRERRSWKKHQLPKTRVQEWHKEEATIKQLVFSVVCCETLWPSLVAHRGLPLVKPHRLLPDHHALARDSVTALQRFHPVGQWLVSTSNSPLSSSWASQCSSGP